MPIEITRTVAIKVLEVVDAGLSKGLGSPVPGEMCVETAVNFALGRPHGDDPGCVSPALRQLNIELNDGAWSSNESRAKGMRRLSIAQLGTLGVLDDLIFVTAVAEATIQTTVPIALRAAASVAGNADHKAPLTAVASRCEKEGTCDAASYAARAASAASYAASAASDAASDAASAASYAARAASYAASYAASAASDAASAASYATSYAASAASCAARAAIAASDAASAASAASDAASAASDAVLSSFAEVVVQVLVKMLAPGAEFLDLAPL